MSSVSDRLVVCLTLYVCLDSGYAFSGAQGQDKLVTDKLTNRLKQAFAEQVFGTFFDPKGTIVSVNDDDPMAGQTLST